MTHLFSISNFKNLFPFIYGVFLTLLAVGLVNCIIDRKGLYGNNKSILHSYQEYAQRLSKATSPIPAMENDRFIKYYLGSCSENSTYVLGSSRAMQINPILEENSITNLGASGASFEDFLTFVGMLLEKDNIPQKIYLVVDPWFFSKDADIRYLELFDLYNKSLSHFNLTFDGSKYYLLKQKIKNIFNKSYFYYNLSSFFSTNNNSLGTYNSDGTINYSNEYEQIKPLLNSKIEPDLKYKMDYINITPSILERFYTVVKISQNKGIKFVFIVLPYHSFINKNQCINIKEKLISFYNALKIISEHLSIPLHGSVLPDNYNLNDEDYYDGIHLRESGLKKVIGSSGVLVE